MALILAIESSCDDMAAAVVRDGSQVLASVVESQDRLHADYGGVVPELASRDHLCAVHRTVTDALGQAGVGLAAIEAIAVTCGPGLIGSLLVGLSFAKALAYRAGLPLIGVHHIWGHLASARLAKPELRLPFVGLVASGGHTSLYRCETLSRPELLGQTRDDAAGEAFDKVAKRLGLAYPGGREIDRRARTGDPRALELPRPMLRDPGLEFSFSGLKTAVAQEIARRESRGPLSARDVDDVAASFQEAVVDVLCEKARRALEITGLERLAVVGGVAANSRLRARIADLSRQTGVEVRFPPLALCTDNAAMIGALADGMLASGRLSGLDLEAFSKLAPRRSR